MSERRTFDNQFDRADRNHDGTIDEQEFRQFLGPVRDERRLSGNISSSDVQVISQSGPTETITYPAGLDAAVAGFTQNPIEYEKFTGGADPEEGHVYGLGPNLGIDAPNVARKFNQYDPVGAIFEYADVHHDGKIDKQEFVTFMHSF